MSTCWKCGKETGNATPECEACESGFDMKDILDEGRRMFREMHDNSDAIDFNKLDGEVEMIEFMRAFIPDYPQPAGLIETLRAFLVNQYGGMRIMKGTPLHEQLKRFLKD